MTRIEAMRKAIETKDMELLRKVVDFCRVRAGMNFQTVFSFANRAVPSLTIDEWDAMMYEIDTDIT